ncbi:MAG: cache domain-containing protein [Rhodospirillales bacterium]|nr:cache domain-containing protein [Rhodospirillales bacterium]
MINWGNVAIRTKLGFIIGVVLVGLGIGSAFTLLDIHNILLTDQEAKTKSIVETAHGIVSRYEKLASEGKMTVEEAKTAAMETVRSMRYDGEEYLWINDMAGVMVMHTTNPKLQGQDLLNLEDKSGKKLFKEMVDVVKQKGDGSVYYYWSMPGEEDPVEKVSYVKGFKPWSWIIGTGVYLDNVNRHFISSMTTLFVFGIILIVTITGLFYIVASDIGGGIRRLEQGMLTLANGDTSAKIAGNDRKDEIGAMARAVEVFRENMIKANRLAEEQHETQEKQIKHAKAIEDLTKVFDSNVSSMLQLVSSAATQMKSTSEELSTTAEETSGKSMTVAAAAEQATSNVQTVATATEELASSVSEISRQVNISNEIAHNAVSEAQRTNKIVGGLTEASSRVGEVVALINDIAEQTNLLALNATIEAARAGEAGKGFAVVASEVKNLANQTARATEEITGQISQMQSVTGEAVGAIQTIGQTIGQINDIAGTIAVAVEQQGEATREIAYNVEEAATGTSEVSSNISDVTRGAEQTGAASSDVLGAANSMSEQAHDLQQTVQQFLDDVRAA